MASRTTSLRCLAALLICGICSATSLFAQIQLTTSLVEFGTVEVAQSSEIEVDGLIYNAGNDRVDIDDIAIEGADADAFRIGGKSGFKLDPGESVAVRFRFEPTRAGAHAAQAVLQGDFSAPGPIQLRGEGGAMTGGETAVMEVTALEVDLGRSEINDQLDVDLSAFITNTGDAPLEIDDMTLSGAAADEFRINGKNSLSLEPGASADLSLRFRPTAEGLRVATLQFVANVDNPPVVQLRGVGVQPEASLSADVIDFGLVTLPGAVEKILSVSNPLDIGLTLEELTIVGGPGESPFIVESAVPLPLEMGPGESHDFLLRFVPKESGAFSGTAELLIHNREEPYSIALSGTAQDENTAELSSELEAFVDTRAGKTSMTLLHLTNPGAARTLTSVSFEGADAAAFSLTAPAPQLPLTIGAASTWDLELLFMPPDTGAFNARLVLTFEQGSHSVALSARGLAPDVVSSVVDLAHSAHLKFGPLPCNEYVELQAALSPLQTVQLAVHSLDGATLLTENLRCDAAGTLRWQWDARTADGALLPPGAYLLRLQIGERAETIPFVRIH